MGNIFKSSPDHNGDKFVYIKARDPNDRYVTVHFKDSGVYGYGGPKDAGSTIFSGGWAVNVDALIKSLEAYRDNGYKEVIETVSVPKTEITAMRKRLDELERGAR